jgi:MurNAc alpha-1-phosphate uridylyltransferase
MWFTLGDRDVKPEPIAAMLLAAGRGERMRPLSDHTPKPLLLVRGKPLMQWHLEALARAGVTRVVVNTGWLGAQIVAQFDSVFVMQRPSDKPGQLLKHEQIEIGYSHEYQDFGGALETAGGIVRALPLLCRANLRSLAGAHLPPSSGDEVFWVLAGDVFAPDFLFSQHDVARFMASDQLAHLWLVPNPAHHPHGDFGLELDHGAARAWPSNMGLALNLTPEDKCLRYTYSSIGLYRKALFSRPWCDIAPGNPQGIKAPLAPLLRAAMDHQLVSAELYAGVCTDVGTPQRLKQLNQCVPLEP